jgi:hypothetical protein
LKKNLWLRGIFCANLYWSVGGYGPCRSLWCGECYTSSPAEISFHIHQGQDEAGNGNGRDQEDQARLTQAWGKRAQSENEYLQARNGDHTLVPFECDLCIFRKLRKSSPDLSSETDKLLLGCIRRMNLDAFWSRSSDTISGHRGKLEHSLKLSKLVGLKGPYQHDGPMPSYDHCGYEVAIQMLLNSKNPGKYSKDYCQWDTIRKVRTAYANQVRASPQANQRAISMGGQDGKYQRLSTDPCASFWFYRFLLGCKRRMGQDWRPNQALSLPLMLAVLDLSNSRVNNAVSDEDAHRWIVFHSYATISYVISLRGTEGLLLDLETIHRY